MRLSSSRSTAIIHRPQQDFPLWDKAGTRPSLDLQFADRKDLVDATTGSNLVDFTRASSGTYVGSDGLIKTATTNLLLQSEDFSTTWTNTESSENTDAIIAPDGTLTADALVDTVISSPHQFIQSVAGLTGSTAYKFSCWMKKGSKDYGALVFSPGSSWGTGSGAIVYFDLVNGTVQSASNATGTIQEFPNGWYRCIATATTAASPGTTSPRIASSESGSSQTYAGDADEAIYVWGAQLEQSTTVGEYVKTTSTINSAPRFDHNPTTGESLGLLVEESRTNLLTYSQDIDASLRVNINTTLDATTAPDGTLSADKIYENTDSAEHYFQRSLASGASGTFTHSVIVKAGERSLVYMRPVHTGEAASTSSCVFDLTTGTASAPSGLASNPTITPYPNGWFRISLTVTLAGLTGTNAFRLHVYNGSTLNYTGDGASGYYVWGYQVEAGSFPSSYIPTTTAAVTRAADVASDTTRGANLRSLYVSFRSPASGTRPVVSLDDNTANERIELLTSGTDPKLLVTDGGSAVADLDAGTVAANTEARLAARFSTDNYGVSINGGTSQLDATGTLPTVNRIRIGSNQAGGYLNGTIARLTGWDATLPMLPPVSG